MRGEVERMVRNTMELALCVVCSGDGKRRGGINETLLCIYPPALTGVRIKETAGLRPAASRFFLFLSFLHPLVPHPVLFLLLFLSSLL